MFCSGNALYTCTPGYPSTGITPASTFGPFLTQTYVPGTCNNYDFARYKYFQIQCLCRSPNSAKWLNQRVASSLPLADLQMDPTEAAVVIQRRTTAGKPMALFLACCNYYTLMIRSSLKD
jgi:hypothetical protein